MKPAIVFLICCALAMSILLSSTAERASAQESDKAKTATVVRKGFQEVSGWVSKSADMVPAEKYNYKPVDTVRTFGQLIGHNTD